MKVYNMVESRSSETAGKDLQVKENDLRYIALVYEQDKEVPNPSIFFGLAFFYQELD